jgi:hypothetical protein
MFKTKSLLLSVAAGELTQHAPSGSIVSLAELRATAVSADLSDALSLVETACAKPRVEIAVVIRPEIFTHGEALAWLNRRVPASSVHLCLSDGEAVRVLPGFSNHAFFYRTGIGRCMRALRDLRRRAPELLGSLGSQVNTAFCFASARSKGGPKPTLLARRPSEQQHLFLPFFVSNGPIERDVEMIAQQEPAPLGADILANRTTFVAVTDTALEDKAFRKALASEIIHTLVDPARTLLMHAPHPDASTDTVDRRVEGLVTALRHEVRFVPSAKPANILIHIEGNGALSQLPEGGQTLIIAHESFPLWRFSPDFYQAFGAANLLRSQRALPQSAARHDVLATLGGRSWTEVTLPHDDEHSLARFGW